MLTGAQVMVKCLEAEGIKAVFGYPGVAICPFYDSLYDSGIRNILVRQEQNGGHMASGYARVTRKPAVCVATSGPGATNLITALATAYADSIPLIAITGQVSSELLGKDVFQEADITGVRITFGGCAASYACWHEDGDSTDGRNQMRGGTADAWLHHGCVRGLRGAVQYML